MSETWYVVTDGQLKEPIKEVEVFSATPHVVFLRNGRRVKRIASFESYFPDWDKARDHLIATCEERIRDLDKARTREVEYLVVIDQMQKPSAAPSNNE
jgi:hypothetical protein